MIKAFLLILLFLGFLRFAMAANTTINGAKVFILGPKVSLNSTVATSTVTVSGTTGQCMGILCAITYSN